MKKHIGVLLSLLTLSCNEQRNPSISVIEGVVLCADERDDPRQILRMVALPKTIIELEAHMREANEPIKKYQLPLSTITQCENAIPGNYIPGSVFQVYVDLSYSRKFQLSFYFLFDSSENLRAVISHYTYIITIP